MTGPLSDGSKGSNHSSCPSLLHNELGSHDYRVEGTVQMCSVLKVGHTAVGKLLTVHNLGPLCLLFSNQQRVLRNN